MSHHDKNPSGKEDPSKSDSSSEELPDHELQLLTIETATDDSPQDSPKPGLTVSKGNPLHEPSDLQKSSLECADIEAESRELGAGPIEPTAGPSGIQESSLDSADRETKTRELGARPKERIAGPSGIQESSLDSADRETETRELGARPKERIAGPSGIQESSLDRETKTRELGARPKEPTSGPSGILESSLDSVDRETKTRELGARPKERIAGQSGLQKSSLNSSDLDTISLDLGTRSEEKHSSTGTVYENWPPSASEGESQSSEPGISNYTQRNSEDTESTSPVFCQSSTGLSFPLEGAVGGIVAELRRKCILSPENLFERYGISNSSSLGPQLRRFNYASESENTSSDLSEIRSETAEILEETGDIPREFPANVRGQSTEASDTSESASTSFGKTTSETIGERLTQSFPEEAQRRDSGSGIESEPSPCKTKREKMRDSKQTNKALAEMRRQRAEEEKAGMVASQSCPDLQSSPRFPVPERSYSVGMQRGDSDTSEGASTSQRTETDASDGTSTSFLKTASESMDERLTQTYPEDAIRRDSGQGILSEPSPSKREREKLRESKQTAKATAEIMRRRDEDEEARMVASQSCPDLLSSPKCPEPKRSCSVGMEHMESSEIESSSETETSKSEVPYPRKPYQYPGHLRELRHPTVSSGDSFASEEAHSSPSRQDSSMEAQDSVPEKMETSPEKSGESVADSVDHETGETLKVEQSTEESKRTARKNKRRTRTSSSPQSDDRPDSSPKEGTSRPKKKAKQDEESDLQVPRSASPDDSCNSSTSEDDTLTGNEHEARTKL